MPRSNFAISPLAVTSPRGQSVVVEKTLTMDQAFEAMRIFLARFNEREPPDRRETITFLLQWTDRSTHADGMTSDPAQWADWEAAVDRALAGNVEPFPGT
jgi:hypothetical protein